MGVLGDLIAGDALPEQYFAAGVLFAIAVYLVISAADRLEAWSSSKRSRGWS